VNSKIGDGDDERVPKDESQALSILFDIGLIALLTIFRFREQIFLGKQIGTENWFNDMFWLTRPVLEYTGQRLADGQLPLWNPYWYAGMPHLAVPSSLVFYPATILFGVINFFTAYKLIVIFHVFVAGTGGYFLGRAISRFRLVSLLLAAQFLFWLGDGRVGHLWVILTLTYSPFSLLCIVKLLQRPSHLWSILFVASMILMILGGDLQFSSYMLLLLGAITAMYLTSETVEDRKNWEKTLRKGTVILSCVLLSLMFCSVLLIPSVEFLEESVRKDGVTYAYSKFTYRDFYLVVRTTWEGLTTHAPHLPIYSKLSLALVLFSFVTRRPKAALILAVTALLCTVYSAMPEGLFENFVRHLPVYGSQRGHIRMVHILYIVYNLLVCLGLHNT